MIKRSTGARFWLPLLAVLLAATSAHAQAGDDPAALDRQVDQLVRAAKYADATEVALRAVALAERQSGADHPNVVQPLSKLAWLYQYQGKHDQAEPLYRRALTIREKALGPDHLDVAISRDILARLYRIQRRYADAEQLLKASLAARENALGPDRPGLCESLGDLAVLYESQGRYSDAEPWRARCLDIREKALGPDHPDVGQSLHELARLYRKLGRRDEAERSFAKAVVVLGPNHPEAVLAAINAGELEKAARALNLPVGDREATAAAVRRTFYGQVTDLRWTGYRSSIGPAAGTIVIEGEATHGNQLWQAFAAQMVRDGTEWKLRAISLLGLAWK